MTKLEPVRGTIKTKGLENYLVAAVNIKQKNPSLWRKVTIGTSSLVANKLSPREILKSYQQQMRIPSVLNQQIKDSAYGLTVEYQRFGLAKHVKLNIRSFLSSLFSKKTYSQIYTERVQALNQKIVEDISSLFGLKAREEKKYLNDEIKNFVKNSRMPLTRILIENLVDDYKVALRDRKVKVTAGQKETVKFSIKPKNAPRKIR